MTDYSKLVEALRCCASGTCDSEKCDYIGMGAYGCMIGLAQNAADAIEELQAEVEKREGLINKALDDNSDLEAEVDALKHDIERYVQINTDQLSRIGYLQKRLCDWCAVCPPERRNPDDCELILDPVTYGPSEYTSTDWATVQQPEL